MGRLGRLDAAVILAAVGWPGSRSRRRARRRMRRRGLRTLLLLVPLLLWLRVPLIGFALIFFVLFLRVHRSRGCEEKEQGSRRDTSN